MNPFRILLASLLALLIASPLCCCSAQAADAAAPRTCCAGKVENQGKDQPDEAPPDCGCKVKEPREEAKKFELPSMVALPFVPVLQELSCLTSPEIVRLPLAATPRTGCDPPRRLLARYSRWLI